MKTKIFKFVIVTYFATLLLGCGSGNNHLDNPALVPVPDKAPQSEVYVRNLTNDDIQKNILNLTEPVYDALLLFEPLPMLTQESPVAALVVSNIGIKTASKITLGYESNVISVESKGLVSSSWMEIANDGLNAEESPINPGESRIYMIKLQPKASKGFTPFTINYFNGTKLTSSTMQILYNNDSPYNPNIYAKGVSDSFAEPRLTTGRVSYSVANLSTKVQLNKIVYKINSTVKNSTVSWDSSSTCTDTLIPSGRCTIVINVASGSVVETGFIVLAIQAKYGTQEQPYSAVSSKINIAITNANNLKLSWIKQTRNGELNGGNYYNVDGVFTPGGRSGAATWVAGDGTLWMFGGYNQQGGEDTNHGLPLADLWRYDSVKKIFVLVKGTYTTVRGQSSDYNALDPLPGARSSPLTWVSQGKLWMFGGDGFSGDHKQYLADLWSYDPLTNKWQFENHQPFSGTNGNNFAGIYGTQKVESPSNHPGSRNGSVTWADKDGNLWMFGGYGFDSTGTASSLGYLNDLWKYNINTDMWSWQGGSKYNYDMTFGDGVLGSRAYAAFWVYNNKVWIFGGNGRDRNNNMQLAYLNDMFTLDIDNPTNVTWVTDNTYGSNKYGVYTESSTTTPRPGSRQFPTFWLADGKFWLYGGYGLPWWSWSSIGNMGDLWSYDPVSKAWRFWGLSEAWNADIKPRYSTDGSQTIGGRQGAQGWAMPDGRTLLFFGGYGMSNLKDSPDRGQYNDIWQITLY